MVSNQRIFFICHVRWQWSLRPGPVARQVQDSSKFFFKNRDFALEVFFEVDILYHIDKQSVD